VFRDFESYVKKEHQRIAFEANGNTDIKCAARDCDLDRLSDLLEETESETMQHEIFIALRVACHQGQLRVVEHLVPIVHPVTIRGDRGLLLLIHAIVGDGSHRNWNDRADIVSLLLHKDKNKSLCHIKDDKDTTALYRASLIGHVEIVKMLLEYDADVNMMNGTCTATFLRTSLYL